MNDEMKSDIERLLAEGELLAAEQGSPTIVTKMVHSGKANYWLAWTTTNPDFVCTCETEFEAIGVLVASQSGQLGILLKRGVQ